MNTASFNAEQAVKRLRPKWHRSWHIGARDGMPDASTLPDALELIGEYRAALISAHQQIIDDNVTYQAHITSNDAQTRKAVDRYTVKLAEEKDELDRYHGRALDAMYVVRAAHRAGRKTVRVEDVLTVFDKGRL